MLQLQVFEWFAWEHFLITHVVPQATRISVEPGTPLRSINPARGAVMAHINLSRPQEAFPDYQDWLEQFEKNGMPVINGYCESIDKWAVQDACAAADLPHVRAGRDGDPDEMLIVKARANHKAKYESLLADEVVGDMAPPAWPYPERVHNFLRKDVPGTIWDDARMTVERYIENRSNRFQRAYVVGDFVAVATSTSSKLLKEMDHRKGVELASTKRATQLPPDNQNSLSVAFRLAQEMRADFAALDLALDDAGIVYPIDLNTTPIWGETAALNPQLIAELVDAFEPLLANGSCYGPTSIRDKNMDEITPVPANG